MLELTLQTRAQLFKALLARNFDRSSINICKIKVGSAQTILNCISIQERNNVIFKCRVSINIYLFSLSLSLSLSLSRHLLPLCVYRLPVPAMILLLKETSAIRPMSVSL